MSQRRRGAKIYMKDRANILFSLLLMAHKNKKNKHSSFLWLCVKWAVKKKDSFSDRRLPGNPSTNIYCTVCVPFVGRSILGMARCPGEREREKEGVPDSIWRLGCHLFLSPAAAMMIIGLLRAL